MPGLSLGLGLGLTNTPAKGGGVPESIIIDGETYTRIRFQGVPLDQEISSQPLYGRAA